jgi:hypothetical protein
MVRYSGFDASNNATTGDFVASLIFRLIISSIAILSILFFPIYNIKCITTMFYLVYTSFNLISIIKSFKTIYWDYFIEDNQKTLSNVCYYRMGFQILETIINYVAIYLIFTNVLLK